MGHRWRNSGNSVRLYFGGLKITAGGDCRHGIKRCLLLGRKAMTILDRILTSRDITLLTKVHLIKAMVFPVVMYGCESWTIIQSPRVVEGVSELDMLATEQQRFLRLSTKELMLSNCGAGEDS